MRYSNAFDTIKGIISLQPELRGILLLLSQRVQTFFFFFASGRGRLLHRRHRTTGQPIPQQPVPEEPVSTNADSRHKYICKYI